MKVLSLGGMLAVLLWPLSALPCQRVPGAHGHVGAGVGAWDFGVRFALGRGLGVGPGFFHACADQPAAHVHVEAPPPVAVYEPAPPPAAVYVPAPPPLVRVEPAPVYVAPAPVYQVAPPPPPPRVEPAPPPAPVPPTVVRVETEPARPRPPRLALKWAPFGVATNELSTSMSVGNQSDRKSLGAEYRLSSRFALRSDLEYGSLGTTWDIAGLKLSLLDDNVVRPYGSVSASGSMAQLRNKAGEVVNTRLNVGLVGAAGLDLYIGRHLFIEAEARYRFVKDPCCSDIPQWTGLIGGGVAFL